VPCLTSGIVYGIQTLAPPSQSLSSLSPSESTFSLQNERSQPQPSLLQTPSDSLPASTPASTQGQGQLGLSAPRRPLRHHLQTRFAHQQSIQQRLLEVQTSPIACTFSAAANQPTLPPLLRSFTGTLFGDAWRGLTERIHTELVNVHALYVHALCKEQHEKDVFRRHCIRLRGERDAARDKLRRLLGEQYDDGLAGPADEGRGVKRGREDGCSGEAGADVPPPSAVSTTSSTSTLVADSSKSHDLPKSPISPVEVESNDLTLPLSYPSPSPSLSSPPPPPPPPTPATHQPIVPPRLTPLLISKLEHHEGLSELGPRGCVLPLGTQATDHERQHELDDNRTARITKRRRTYDGEPVRVDGVLREECPDNDDTRENDISAGPGDTTAPQLNGTETMPAPISPRPVIKPIMTTATAMCNRISIRNHVDLMYLSINDKLVCRVCA
jgi:hypothetical protein